MKSGFVLDCSMAMTWCFEDEATPETDKILECFTNKIAVVPALWHLEVANVIALAERKGRLTENEAMEFWSLVDSLPITTDNILPERGRKEIFHLARQYDLTVYDAAYLDIAIRYSFPLATLDKELIQTARRIDIQTIPE